MRQVLAALLLPAALLAQRAPAITLKPADAKLDEEFSDIRALRELSDGRVLVVDAREQRVIVADLKTGAVSPVGRQGNGPGEYRYPRVLLALRGDSSLLMSAGRWLLMDDARIAATLSGEPAVHAASGDPIGADTGAFIYVRRPGTPARVDANVTVRADSAVVIRIERATGHSDTIARLAVSPSKYKTAIMENGGRAERWTPVPFPLNDEAIAFPDGWVAIVRAEPYRVDWWWSDGGTRRGAPIPVVLPSLTERDRQALIDSLPHRPNRMPDFDFSAFPAKAPPFQSDALIAGPLGRVFIRRTVTASQPGNRYDIADRRGALTAQLTLPRNEWLIGFGTKSAYIVVTDDDGIQRLRRHPWP